MIPALNWIRLYNSYFLYFLKKKFFLYFGKWSFWALKFLTFSQKSFSYISGNRAFQEETFRARKIKKPTPKNFLYFGKWNFLALRLKTFLYFRRELFELEKQKFISLKKVLPTFLDGCWSSRKRKKSLVLWDDCWSSHKIKKFL